MAKKIREFILPARRIMIWFISNSAAARKSKANAVLWNWSLAKWS